MKKNAPHFHEYITQKLIIVFLSIAAVIIALVWMLNISRMQALYISLLIFVAFTIFYFFVRNYTIRIEKELKSISRSLKNIDKLDNIDKDATFFTKEFIDINKHLYKALKKFNDRADGSKRYNAKLKLKNRQRTDMLHAIAHEFRNPIAAIMGYSQTLHEDKEIPQELQEKFLEKIYANSTKIEMLLGRLILWNKFESKETKLQHSEFDLFGVAKGVVETLSDKYTDRSITLKGQKSFISADKALLELVIENLIENALKYSKEKVTVSVAESSLVVTDRGVGISDTEIDKITKKFYRSSEHTWNNSMGLGLAIVKRILTLHDTSLQIESQKEVGSQFSFDFTNLKVGEVKKSIDLV